MNLRIGPSGNSVEFYESGRKNTEQMPKWLCEMGLNAYEYSFGRGVNLSHAKAELIRSEAEKYGILISGHAPYFINLANPDLGMLDKSYTYITSSAEMVKALGGNRVIFHPATEGKLKRDEAVSNMLDTSKILVDKIYDAGFSDMIFCPETMGKMKQIGDTSEILEICKIWENFIPCIDFGHLNSRTLGGLKTTKDFEIEIDKILQAIGERGKNFHIHFSKIMYGPKGELKHLTFEDDKYGPEFEPLAEAIKKMGVTPTIICESAGTQSIDAREIKKIMEK